MTVLDLVKASLRKIRVLGAGETPSGSEGSEALDTLNALLQSWSNEGLAVYRQTLSTHATVAGTASYTIGTGATWDTTRPLRIDQAFLRTTSDNIDDQLTLLSATEYYAVRDKATASEPTHLYYLPSMTTGTVYLWPVPDAVYTVGIVQNTQIAAYLTLAADVGLPPGYEQALIYNLAVELAPEYGKSAADVAGLAREYKMVLKRTNHRITHNAPDACLLGQSRSNILTGDPQ